MPYRLLPLLLFLLVGIPSVAPLYSQQYHLGAITRGDTIRKEIALVFTGHEFAEGGQAILKTLTQQNSRASFFFTGDFYRNPSFSALIFSLKEAGHYLGAHSDRHLLYCDWSQRDSLLVKKTEFIQDLLNNYREMERFGIEEEAAAYFLPPYEWYNDSIARWTGEAGLQLINFTPGTLSHADYTTPSMPNYRSSRTIYQSILKYEETSPAGLKGFLLLVHIGSGPQREDKFHLLLDNLIRELKSKGYRFVRVDELLE